MEVFIQHYNFADYQGIIPINIGITFPKYSVRQHSPVFNHVPVIGSVTHRKIHYHGIQTQLQSSITSSIEMDGSCNKLVGLRTTKLY